MFDATLEGEADVVRQWGQAYGALKNSMRYAVSKGTKEGAREARTKHTFKNRTGELEKSIDGFVIGWTESGLKITGIIRAAAKHAGFVEYATPQHYIPSDTRFMPPGKWLVWTGGKYGPGPHFAKSVLHPGTKAQPFMHLAYFKCERVMVREIEIGIVRMQKIIDA